MTPRVHQPYRTYSPGSSLSLCFQISILLIALQICLKLSEFGVRRSFIVKTQDGVQRSGRSHPVEDGSTAVLGRIIRIVTKS